MGAKLQKSNLELYNRRLSVIGKVFKGLGRPTSMQGIERMAMKED